MKLSLRPATEQDRAFCESLSRTNMAGYYAARNIAWEPQRFVASWAEFENFVILASEHPVGVLRLFEVQEIIEIRDLQILASHWSKGIGTWAIAQARAIASQRGLGALRLRVFEENPAKHLYARLGFQVAAVEGGIVHMSYALPPNNSSQPKPHRDSAQFNPLSSQSGHSMQIATSLESVVLRPWRHEDRAELAMQANDHSVWRNLLAGFPHPYTESDAEYWCTEGAHAMPGLHLCVQVDGAVAGAIGVTSGSGTEEKTGQFGYWLGRQYWGRGIATVAATSMLAHIVNNMPLARLQAPVFEWNPRSMRVLEKIGFEREAVLRKSVFKDSQLIDCVLYAYIVSDV
jgi:[ribosomal protein S5]-alanine N-acetyltransferase